MSEFEADLALGRIPFAIRIGVTGHRDLRENPELTECVRQQVTWICSLLWTDATPVHLTVVSQLADGADRLVVHQVFAEAEERGEEAHLEVFLPMDRNQYVDEQRFTPSSINEFEELMSRATFVSEPGPEAIETTDARANAYESAGRLLVGRSDVLIALWDGRSTGGKGGTAETLLYASSAAMPCVWISTEGNPEVEHNLEPGTVGDFHSKVQARAELPEPPNWLVNPESHDALSTLRVAHRPQAEFNLESVPVDFAVRLRQELDSGIADWVASPFLRASLLAARWRSRFQWAAIAISLLVAAAALMLAISLSYGKDSAIWPLAEATCFSLVFIGLFVVRRLQIHDRWLSYRVLAERLRTANYLAPTGAHLWREATVDALYTGRREGAWIMRAFEFVWDERPFRSPDLAKLSGDDLDSLKRWLADDWIGGQILYHRGAARRHRLRYLALSGSVFALFGVAVAFAFMHTFQVVETASTLFSIFLPALGASIGVVLTVNQDQALSERYTRMQSDLALVRRNLLDANTAGLERASSEAAQVVGREADAWFGAMWFLDIEHP